MKHSRGRITSLSDGVFAFAATLMVVDLGTTIDFNHLDNQISSFISFGIAFFVMMLLWKLHYNFFQRTKYVDNWIIATNIILLFTVLFYLFPLKSLINSITKKTQLGEDGLSHLFLLYGFGFALIFSCYAFLYYRAYKKDKNNKNTSLLLFYHKHFVIFIFTAVLSIVLAFFKVGITFGLPGFAYSTLGITCYINVLRFKKKHPDAFKN
ncbi:TMEM175 family protein [Psychroserpens sp.]|uniref:TMEM175 family protein n=1 Tax=Psychroserpens sp. TaxID=2020870 RepID=UPI00385B6031